MNRRNPVARALAQQSLRQKIVRPKKGRGSYSRKGRKAHDHQLNCSGVPPPAMSIRSPQFCFNRKPSHAQDRHCNRRYDFGE